LKKVDKVGGIRHYRRKIERHTISVSATSNIIETSPRETVLSTEVSKPMFYAESDLLISHIIPVEDSIKNYFTGIDMHEVWPKKNCYQKPFKKQ